MALRRKLRHVRQRVVLWSGTALVVGLIGLSVAAPLSYVTIHHTAQPEFCKSCHIMEPYYESWHNSSHSEVSCIECHYEPGAVETFKGKFQALSQVAKYVTRTAGTKPWADVSDTSCTRSGCHSVRMLEGPVQFGRIAFDHRHHLLEARRGRRLRCVSCHSQIVQGEHVSVTESVCFTCHFMPDSHGKRPEHASGCLTCHGPPSEPVMIGERPFDHREYTARGVDCRECHDPVVEGDGLVRRERCHSCHAEIGHIERIGETAFMHETHVTNRKVECFECHDEIRHGLLPLDTQEPAASEGCGTCHRDSHGAARMLYTGTGAIGTEDAPSRMYETRVVCRACHSGRSRGGGGRDVADAHGGSAPDSHAFGSVLAEAGNMDCIHCHGTGFDGMLGRWQESVASQLERLGPLLDELADELPEDREHPARQLFGEARHNVDLVSLDGSRGAHNIDYALDALEAGAERIDRARELLGLAGDVRASEGFPFRSEHGCSTCHAGLSGASLPDGRTFPHERHLADTELDCDACHSVENHGETTVTAADCSSCHHQESEQVDVWDCAACHAPQERMLRGTLADLEPAPGSMSDMECTECHGEPPSIVRPKARLCVLCHEQGYDHLQGQWQSEVARQLDRLEPLLADVSAHDSTSGDGSAGPLCERARESIEAVAGDGSLGVHNTTAAFHALWDAADRIDRARELLDLDGNPPAVDGLPFRSEHGCSVCHFGIEGAAATLPNGRPFPHRAHVQTAGMDCDACHSVEDHGQPSASRENCVDCHHRETEEFEFWNCSGCHADQRAFLLGSVVGFEPHPAAMSEMDCVECHGEPPAMVEPTPRLCVLCHEKGYDRLHVEWQESTEGLAAELEAALAAAGEDVAPVDIERAREALSAVRRDGSRGVHNYDLARAMLEGALAGLRDQR